MTTTKPTWSSVSRHIIIGLGVEIVVVSAAAAWWTGLGIGWSVLVALGLLVAFRVVLALLSFVLAWWFRSAEARSPLGWGGWCRLVAAEILAYLELFFVWLPLQPWLETEPDAATAPGGPTPIVLVHGFFANAGFWYRIIQYLRRGGREPLYTINLEPAFGDIDALTGQLAGRIEEVCSAAQSEQVMLVAHSMGGLVCRAYLAAHGPGRVRKLLTLGTPHHGTMLAWLVPGPNLKQMRPGSGWLNAINEGETLPVPVHSGYSLHDNIIAPQDSSRLAGAVVTEFRGIGHLSMAFSSTIMEWLLAETALDP